MRAVLRRSAIVALLVGTMLNLINQPDALLGEMPLDLFKLVLTYLVPFCVATYGAYAAGGLRIATEDRA
ncbi:MAG: nitrate/nitrite transporter NrtS [Pseudomonadota bacterium]